MRPNTHTTASFAFAALLSAQTCDGGGSRALGVAAGAQPPVCPGNLTVELWPPNHEYRPVDLAALAGVTDPQGLAITISIDSLTQDEPVNDTGDGNTQCDAFGIGAAVAQVRAERSGNGDGRVYRIGYTATNAVGLSCSSIVRVTVPHDQADPAVEDAASFDSTAGCP